MKYETEERDGKFYVKAIWPDGYEHEYGPFDNRNIAEGYKQGFSEGIDCHY